MNKAELVAQQLLGGNLNKVQWGSAMYNVLVEGLAGGGVVDDTAKLQVLVDKAIAEGRKAIFFPYGTNGQYRVTALTNANQVVFFGDNASFVGGYSGTINQLGQSGDLSAYATQAFVSLNYVAKGSLVYNVKDYGATGDGTTNDTLAIQTAIDAAGSGIVFFPQGTYIVTDELKVKSINSRLCGAGHASTIKQTVDGKNGINVGLNNGVIIRDLRILTGGYSPTSGNGVHSDQAGDLLIYNVVCQDFFNGFYIDTRTLVTQSQVYIDSCNAYSNNGAGYNLNNGTDVVLTNCRGLSNKIGAFVMDSSGVTMNNCLFNSNTEDGVFFDGTANDWNFINQTICDGNGKYGFHLKTSRGLQISNSWAGTNDDAGFLIDSLCKDMIISNSQARNNGTHGFQLNAAVNIAFDNCMSINNQRIGTTARSGFFLGGVSNRIKISNCFIYGDLSRQATGITIGGSATNCNISDNTIYGNTAAQLSGAVSGHIVRRNNGFKTESSGTATVPSAVGTVVVNHGLVTNPTRILITPTSDFGSARWWVTAVSATSFTIAFNATQASDVTFNWEAFVGDHNYT